MRSDQTSLFGDRGPDGFRLVDDVVTSDEERILIERIEAVKLDPFKFHGWFGKRLTASFGWRYDFDKAAVEPAEPVPDWLLPIRERAAALVGQPADALVQALLIRYGPGAGIGWHRDRPVFARVVGLSLGAETTLRFRRARERGFDRFAARLPPRSMYCLTDEIRHQWEHSISPMDAVRWSVTFRSLADLPRRRSGSR